MNFSTQTGKYGIDSIKILQEEINVMENRRMKTDTNNAVITVQTETGVMESLEMTKAIMHD